MRFRRRKTPIISTEEREKKRFPWGKVVYFAIIGVIVVGFGIWGFQKLIFIKGRGVLEAEAVKVESKLNARIIEIRPGINDRVSRDEPVVFLDKASLPVQTAAEGTGLSRKDNFSTYELLEAANTLEFVEEEKKNQEEWVNDLRKEYDRAKRLLALEAITRPQFLEIEENFKTEERKLSLLSTELGLAKTSYEAYKYDTVLISPISGVVTKIYKAPGEMALKGEPIIAIADPSKLFVMTYFNESDEDKIHVGEKARVVFENGDKYKGEIRVIYRASQKLPKIYRGYYEDREAPIVAEVFLLTDKPPAQTIGTRAKVLLRRPWF